MDIQATLSPSTVPHSRNVQLRKIWASISEALNSPAIETGVQSHSKTIVDVFLSSCIC